MRAVRKHILSMVCIYGLGIFSAAWLTSWIYGLQEQGLSPAAIAMSAHMDMTDMNQYWSFPLLQASGLAALIFSYCSIILGILPYALHKNFINSIGNANFWHRHFSILVLILILVHMVATAMDSMGDSWKTVLLFSQWAEQGWPEAVLGYNLGIAAFYILLLLGPTYYALHSSGYAKWKILHRFIFLFYALSLFHALILGLDIAYYSWIRPFLWAIQVPLFALVIIRVSRYLNSFKNADNFLGKFTKISLVFTRVACVVFIVSIAYIVFSGNSGFIKTV
jgi:predicted ferric reductase